MSCVNEAIFKARLNIIWLKSRTFKIDKLFIHFNAFKRRKRDVVHLFIYINRLLTHV